MLPGNCLHAIFAERARLMPDRIALVLPGGTVSYGELDARSDRLAWRLAELGVRPDALVGLCSHRSPAAIVGMLGILKAGGAYVPIDPGYPAERIDYLLADCAAPIVVASADSAAVMTGWRGSVVWLDRDGVMAGPAATGRGAPATGATGRNLAYVIYTSGSTGDPKGVAVEHGNVVRLFDQTDRWFGFGSHDTWSLFHSISFDFSVWEIWGALLFGGRLVLLPEQVTRSPESLVSLLRAEQVTVLNQTPSAFHQLTSVLFAEGRGADSTSGLALRLVIFGGERLDARMLEPWLARHGDARPALVNMYGITETTVHCTYRRITMADLDDGAESRIGVPLPDLRVHLLDGRRRPVPDNTPGEMYIAGPGLARGYLNRPGLTDERFLSDVRELGEERLYRSGDRAKRLPGGELVYLGRMDDQLKVRGFRIEPGEVEECLSRVPGIAGVAVTSRDFGGGDVRLVAYLVPARGAGASQDTATRLETAARQHARATLPRYLRPSAYQVISEIPLTIQGKVNRHALGR